jgi:hypothetical protein
MREQRAKERPGKRGGSERKEGGREERREGTREEPSGKFLSTFILKFLKFFICHVKN